MPEPLIVLPLPTRSDALYNRECLPAYLDAIRQMQGRPVAVTPQMSADEVRTALRQADGIVLTGSPADVDTARYGQDRGTYTASPDSWREDTDQLLLEQAAQRNLPVLGICYGLQSLNVWRGGSLVQDLEVLPVSHPAGPSVAVAHGVEIREGSLLASLAAAAGDTTRILVNSSHHQAVGREGDGLRVVARCPQDGVVEALEGDRAHVGFQVLGVQWHPERSVANSAVSREIFGWLVREAQAQ